jgi:hypothetical protein
MNRQALITARPTHNGQWVIDMVQLQVPEPWHRRSALGG